MKREKKKLNKSSERNSNIHETFDTHQINLIFYLFSTFCFFRKFLIVYVRFKIFIVGARYN